MLTKNDLQQIRTIVKEEVEPVKASVERVDKKLDKAQEDISVILSEVIQHNDNLQERVVRIEDHLDLPKVQ